MDLLPNSVAGGTTLDNIIRDGHFDKLIDPFSRSKSEILLDLYFRFIHSTYRYL